NDPGKMLKDAIDKQAAGALVAGTSTSTHSVATDSTPALQAAETGATSTARDESMIETRTIVPTHGIHETSVESFFGRSSLVGMPLLATGTSITHWRIDFREFVQLRAKMSWFTYMRFDVEFTIIATSSTGQNVTTEQHTTYQVMYVPPGAPVPSNQDSFQWQSGCNPSVFADTDGPPAQFSVPFMSSANAYSTVYDGYARFMDTDPDRYGILPSNFLGFMYFRTLEDAAHQVRFRIYAKIKHTSCWIPRAPRQAPYKKRYNLVFSGDSDRICSNRASLTSY
uniref:BOVINE ENTEROVIRUS COAT PROTEINS VP1 TO VP4 n=1 Tax=Bovine enterovirus (strain VG-5-27) TaxID=12065 RepID=UPI00001108A1|nr:Chain 1, BOVINE ENTEROVIRUS COAT PROTEINS VP1 TO VP4 [Enterovirus E]